MIDKDDAELFLLTSNPTSCLGVAVVLVITGILYYVATQNERECEAKPCPHGIARVIDHECLCVDRPEP